MGAVSTGLQDSGQRRTRAQPPRPRAAQLVVSRGLPAAHGATPPAGQPSPAPSAGPVQSWSWSTWLALPGPPHQPLCAWRTGAEELGPQVAPHVTCHQKQAEGRRCWHGGLGCLPGPGRALVSVWPPHPDDAARPEGTRGLGLHPVPWEPGQRRHLLAPREGPVRLLAGPRVRCLPCTPRGHAFGGSLGVESGARAVRGQGPRVAVMPPKP